MFRPKRSSAVEGLVSTSVAAICMHCLCSNPSQFILHLLLVLSNHAVRSHCAKRILFDFSLLRFWSIYCAAMRYWGLSVVAERRATRLGGPV